ncbi:MAG: poly(R)-hydroxyalkanoic acid synthase subunit PhaE [Desulfosalsimonas sp.]
MSQAIQETWFNSGLIDSEDPVRCMAKSLDNAVEITQNWIEEANQLFRQGLNGIQQSMSESQQDSQTPSFQAMIEAYSMSMQKMLNMPKLGLNREYQERITQAIDKLNLLTTVACEFSLLLLQPVQHSLIKMQHKLREMPESDGYSEDIKEYYAMWIKMLEGGYMQLLQSPEFVSSFHRVMNAYMEFQAIYEDVMQDALRGMPVAKKNDLEEVYKENHLLKKEVKAMSARIAKLEKKLEELESYKNEKI